MAVVCPDAECGRSHVYVYLNSFPMPSADGYTLYSVPKRATAVGEDDFFVQRRPHISVFVHYVVNLTSYQNTGNAQHTVRIAGDPMGNHTPR